MMGNMTNGTFDVNENTMVICNGKIDGMKK